MIKAPGVYLEEQFEQVAEGVRTAVPLFLGYVEPKPGQAKAGSWPEIRRLTSASHFDQLFLVSAGSYLRHAVAGFFANGGQLCYVAPMTYDPDAPATVLAAKLAKLAAFQEIDLVCAPDIMVHLPAGNRGEFNGQAAMSTIDTATVDTATVDTATVDMATVVQMQQLLLEHCDRLGDRFAILDAVGSPVAASQQEAQAVVSRQRQALYGVNGALYFPWVLVRTLDGSHNHFVPPCGHIAGLFARTDQRSGVHKAPANEVLEGVTDLQCRLDDAGQGPLNDQGINCLRAFPGRGIRVWGARTLSQDPAWTYVNVRRLLLTAGRWIERSLADLVFEPNDPRLWARIRRELTVYLDGLYQRGALKGASAAEAFYVKCDAETNPADVRETGRVVTEIGLSPALPGEIIVIRIVHGAEGVTISGP